MLSLFHTVQKSPWDTLGLLSLLQSSLAVALAAHLPPALATSFSHQWLTMTES
jgi:hypothetical protein